jgi:phage tail tape-measure protein
MSDRAVEAGRTAGTLLGVLSGAEVGTAAIRIPVVGPLMGAFVGGLVGSSAGQVLAMLASKGSSLVLDTFAVGLAKAANYGAKRAEAVVPEPPRPDLPPVPAPSAAGREGGAKRTGG